MVSGATGKALQRCGTDAGAVAGAGAPGVRTSTAAPFFRKEDFRSRLRTQNRSLAGVGPFGNVREARAVAALGGKGDWSLAAIFEVGKKPQRAAFTRSRREFSGDRRNEIFESIDHIILIFAFQHLRQILGNIKLC